MKNMSKDRVKINRYNVLIILVIIIGICVLGILENNFFEIINKNNNLKQLLKYEYWIKSLFKVSIFLIIYLLCEKIVKQNNLVVKNIYKIKENIMEKQKTKYLRLNYSRLFLLQLVIVILSILGYMLSLKFVSIDNIREGSISKNITKSNYIYVYTYIILFNSLFEELFFRGYIYLKLSNIFKYSSIISAIFFSIYHIAILYRFVVWYQIILLVIVLFIVGLFFNVLDKESNTIIPSYLIHASANFSINLVTALLIFF